MPKLLDRDHWLDAGTLAAAVTDPPGWRTACLNCGAPLAGQFCATCGQRAVPPHPTLRELAGDAYGELAGWDGKVAETIRLLLRRPGELTRLLLDGQRARQVSPVRLYLACSLIYFLVAAAAPAPNVEMQVDSGIGFTTPAGADQVAPTPSQIALTKAINTGMAKLTPDERALARREIDAQPKLMQPMLRAMAIDSQGLKQRATEVMPRALFVLIPALAGILAVFFRGRHFPEHLYFAIHFQAFAFLALAVSALAQYASSIPVILAGELVAAIAIVVYGVLAVRRVYGGSWLATGLKTLGVAVLYGALWSTTVFAVTLWASRGASG